MPPDGGGAAKALAFDWELCYNNPSGKIERGVLPSVCLRMMVSGIPLSQGEGAG